MGRTIPGSVRDAARFEAVPPILPTPEPKECAEHTIQPTTVLRRPANPGVEPLPSSLGRSQWSADGRRNSPCHLQYVALARSRHAAHMLFPTTSTATIPRTVAPALSNLGNSSRETPTASTAMTFPIGRWNLASGTSRLWRRTGSAAHTEP